MYTLESLQQKNLKELKEIGWELNVLPDGDRRCRQNWIDALVGVQPPLLQLMEVSPGVEVEPVAEAIEIQRQEPLLESSPSALVCPFCNAAHALYTTRDCLDKPIIRCLHCNYCRIKHYPGPILLEAQEPPIHRPETKDGIDLQDFTVQVQEPPIESKFGRIVYPKASIKPIAQNAETRPQLDRTESADVHNWRSHPAESVRDSSSAKAEALGSKEGDRVLALAGNSEAVRGGVLPHQPTQLAAFNDEQPPNRGDGKGRIEPKLNQSAIAPAAKNSPGVSRKTSTAHQLLELFKSSAHIIEDSSAAETEAEVLESAIVPAAKNHLDQEEGITLSSTFLARYSPPQPENIHYQADADGQLSLLNFEVEKWDEPPDPDDFASLDAFREAMARWDAENSEALMGSMDSMCEWAPCPDDWYEPEAGIMPLKASSMIEVMEVAPTSSDHLPSRSDHYEVRKCWNFFIPTFDAWCDRAARQTDTDEPPDTGSFAKLPGPKPPKFPPMSVIPGDRANRIKEFARSAALVSGRAPPGGDAMH